MVGVAVPITKHETSHVSGGTDEIDSALALTAIPAHGYAKHTDRVHKVFLPMGKVENCTPTAKGSFDTQDTNGATARVYGTCIVPPDYVSSGNIKMIFVDGGVAQACGVACDTPHDGELHTAGGGAGIATLTTTTVNFLRIFSLGFDLSGVAAGDVIGFYYDSNDANHVYVIGFQFEYLGDE